MLQLLFYNSEASCSRVWEGGGGGDTDICRSRGIGMGFSDVQNEAFFAYKLQDLVFIFLPESLHVVPS